MNMPTLPPSSQHFSYLVAMTTTILSPPNFLGSLGALSPNVPLISVHGSLTITATLWSALIIFRWWVTGCFGAFPNFLPDIPGSCMMRQFLHFDGVYDALAINTKALSLIPHFLQHFGSNTCSMFFKNNEIIIRKGTWNRRVTFYLKVVMLQLFQGFVPGFQLV